MATPTPPGARSVRRDALERIGLQFVALFGSLMFALAVGSILIIGYGENPVDIYLSIVRAALGDRDGIGYVLATATPLIFSGLAIAVCFKGGLFNIGVEGQYLIGMVTAAVTALTLGSLPGVLLVPAILVGGALGGMAWAAIPAILKVKTGAHEVVTTIMLNGIAVSLIAWAINFPLKYEAPPGLNVDLRSDPFPEQGLVGDLGGLFGITSGAKLSWLFPLGVVTAIVIAFVLRRTRLGYDARAVGSSPGSARAGGVSIGATQIKLFLLSGALAGLTGMQLLLADKGYLPQNYVSQLGFTGIAVAFLGQNSPIAIVFAAILWGVLSRGEVVLQIESAIPREFIIILQGILILSVIITYLIARRRIAALEISRAGVYDTESAEDR